jgi:hypothetical protein
VTPKIVVKSGEVTEETKRLLDEAVELLDQNPLQGYFPHGKQTAFHESQQKVKVFVGGNRSGKTTAGVADNLIQALDRDVIPERLQQFKKWEPPFYCRIVTPDFTRTMAAVLEAVRKWVPTDQLQGGTWEKAWDKQNRILSFANGSFIEAMTYEQDLDKFGGTARHRIHYDEEPPGEKGESIRIECQGRLVDYNGDEMFTFTPLLGLSWTFDQLWEARGPEVSKDVWRDSDLSVVRADMDDNPHISEEGKQAFLANLPDKIRQARKSGDFTHFKGLVYEEFDLDRHVANKEPSIEHVRNLTTIVGIDPGIRTTAVVFAGFDKDNTMLIFDELYLHESDAIPENVAVAIKGRNRLWGIDPHYYVIDPSARNRSLVNADNVEAAFQRAGLTTVPGQNELEAGIFEIKRRLQSEPTGIIVSPKCEKWLWERRGYRFDDTSDGRISVVKTRDHLLDATRYVAMERTYVAPVDPKPHRRAASFVYQPAYTTERPMPPEPGPLGEYS